MPSAKNTPAKMLIWAICCPVPDLRQAFATKGLEKAARDIYHAQRQSNWWALEKRKQIMFSKILVAVDGSEHSRNAVRYASDLAQKYGAALHMVHAPQIEVETLTLGSGMVKTMPTHELMAAQGGAVISKAEQWAVEAGHKADITEILTGDTAKAILQYVDANGIDLIVTGSRGLGGLRGLLQGSVSQKLTSHATCPVLTVR